MKLVDLKEPDILLMKRWATDGMSSLEPAEKTRLSKLANALGSGGVRGQDCREFALAYEVEVPEEVEPTLETEPESDPAEETKKRGPGRPKKDG